MASRPPYSPVVLWAFWSSHLVLLTCELVVFGYCVLDIIARQPIPVGYAICLALLFVNFCLEPLEAEFWWHNRLTQRFYLCLQVFKALLWTGFTPFGVLLILRGDMQPQWFAYMVKPVLYALVGATVLSFYGSLYYAVVIWRRTRDRNDSYVENEERRKRESLKILLSRSRS